MRVLYVCHEPIPSPSTNTEQVIKAAAAMAALGVEVVVSTPSPDSEGRGLVERTSTFYDVPRHLFDDGLSLASLPTPPPLAGTRCSRPWHAVRAAWFGRAAAFDFVCTRDPIPLLTGLLAGRPVLFETYRYDLNTRPAYALWRRFCYSHPNLLGVVTHSELSKGSFTKVGFPEERLLVAHNGFNPPSEMMMDRDPARDRLGIDRDVPLVVYAGDVRPAKGVDSILTVAAAMPHVLFLVVGHEPDSPGQRWFERTVDRGRHTNVRMVERVPPARVATYLSAADCLFIPTVRAPLYDAARTVLPLKTFRYLGAGRPIVAPDLPDLREVLRSDHNAILVEPDRPEVTVAAVTRILDDRALAERLGAQARRTVDGLDWSTRAHKILEFATRSLSAR